MLNRKHLEVHVHGSFQRYLQQPPVNPKTWRDLSKFIISLDKIGKKKKVMTTFQLNMEIRSILLEAS